MSFATLQALLTELQQGGVRAIHFAGGGESTLLRGLFPRKSEARSLVTDLANSDPIVTIGLITNGSVFEHFDLDSMVASMTWIRFSGACPARS